MKLTKSHNLFFLLSAYRAMVCCADITDSALGYTISRANPHPR